MTLTSTRNVNNLFLNTLSTIRRPRTRFRSLTLPQKRRNRQLPRNNPFNTLFRPLTSRIFITTRSIKRGRLITIAIRIREFISTNLLTAIKAFTRVRWGLITSTTTYMNNGFSISFQHRNVSHFSRPSNTSKSRILNESTNIFMLFNGMSRRPRIINSRIVPHNTITYRRPNRRNFFLLQHRKQQRTKHPNSVINNAKTSRRGMRPARGQWRIVRQGTSFL